MTIMKKGMRFLGTAFPQRRPPAPLLLLFHVTTRCNMACRHCGDDVWGDPANDLSFEEIRRFSASLGKVETIAIGGGEPFLRADLADICGLFAAGNGVKAIGIASNGYSSELVCTATRTILSGCPGVAVNIMLSLDGFEETHDAIRRPGSFARVLETADRLKSLETEFPRLAVTFNATISEKNREEIPSLARFVQERFGSRLEYNIICGNPRDPSFTVPEQKELARILDRIGELSPPTSPLRRLYQRVYRATLLRTNYGGRSPVPCRAGSLVCLVDANGDVRVCPSFPPLGNLKSASFQEIWHGPEAKRQLRAILSGACRCNNDCFTRISLSHYWKLPFLLLRALLTGTGTMRNER